MNEARLQRLDLKQFALVKFGSGFHEILLAFRSLFMKNLRIISFLYTNIKIVKKVEVLIEICHLLNMS